MNYSKPSWKKIFSANANVNLGTANIIAPKFPPIENIAAKVMMMRPEGPNKTSPNDTKAPVLLVESGTIET